MSVSIEKTSQPFPFAKRIPLGKLPMNCKETRIGSSPPLYAGSACEQQLSDSDMTAQNSPVGYRWCGGWDSNPRTPTGQGPKPCAFKRCDPSSRSLTWLGNPRNSRPASGFIQVAKCWDKTVSRSSPLPRQERLTGGFRVFPEVFEIVLSELHKTNVI